MYRALVILSCALIAHSSLASDLTKSDFTGSDARDGGIFGIELAFTNQELVQKSAPVKGIVTNLYFNQGVPRPYPLIKDLYEIRKQWIKKMALVCGNPGDFRDRIEDECESADEKTFKVKYEDGWWYKVDVDHGVIEVNAAPLTARGYEKAEVRIQRDIFDVAKSFGIEPYKSYGDGHIHLDLVSNFRVNGKLNAMLFRNFFVDFQNHGAMVLGAIGNAVTNAPIAIEGKEAVTAFSAVLSNLDTSMVDPGIDERKKVEMFATQVSSRVYKKPFLPSLEALSKNHALNLDGLKSPSTKAILSRLFTTSGSLPTLEIRALPPQRDAKDIVLLTRLFKRRIDYLRQIGFEGGICCVRLPYNRLSLYTYDDVKDNHHKIRLPQESIDAFKDYVTGAQMNWEEFKPLVRGALFNRYWPHERLAKRYLDNLEKFRRAFFSQTPWEKFLQTWSTQVSSGLSELNLEPSPSENFSIDEVNAMWMDSISNSYSDAFSDWVVAEECSGRSLEDSQACIDDIELRMMTGLRTLNIEVFKDTIKLTTPKTRFRLLMFLDLFAYSKKLNLDSAGVIQLIGSDEVVGELRYYVDEDILQVLLGRQTQIEKLQNHYYENLEHYYKLFFSKKASFEVFLKQWEADVTGFQGRPYKSPRLKEPSSQDLLEAQWKSALNKFYRNEISREIAIGKCQNPPRAGECKQEASKIDSRLEEVGFDYFAEPLHMDAQPQTRFRILMILDALVYAHQQGLDVAMVRWQIASKQMLQELERQVNPTLLEMLYRKR